MGKTALVLAGGGSRGAYEIGVWRALGELDERFELVTGTSVGALNGAVIAQGSQELAENLWRELETSRIFDVDLDEALPQKQKILSAICLFGKAAVESGGAGTNALAALLHEYLNENEIRRSPIDLGIVTVELNTVTPRYIWKDEMPSGQLIDYLIASSSLFPAVRPHKIDGKQYIDGGYSDNLPIRMAIDRGAEKIIAVSLDAIGVVRYDPSFLHYDIRTIHSYWDLGSVLLFDPHSARFNMRLGYLDAMRSYHVYDGFAYAFLRGTLHTVTRQFYHTFYEDTELLGFSSIRHRFLDSIAYKAFERHVFRRNIKPAALSGFALDGMESAAELLALNVTTVYSFEKLTTRLKEALILAPIPAALANAQTLNTFISALQRVEKSTRVRALAQYIRAHLATRTSVNLLPTAMLLPDEFSAALFLVEAKVAF